MVSEAHAAEMQSRVIERMRQIADDDLTAMERFERHFVISTDELLAHIIRSTSGAGRGAALREAGFSALADALGL